MIRTVIPVLQLYIACGHVLSAAAVGAHAHHHAHGIHDSAFFLGEVVFYISDNGISRLVGGTRSHKDIDVDQALILDRQKGSGHFFQCPDCTADKEYIDKHYLA